jgi:hypothetical protein
LPSAAANAPAKPKRRVLWYRYAAAASVAIAAFGTWWIQAPRQQAAGNQQPVTSNQSPVASNQQPVTSNQQPIASRQLLVRSNPSPETSSQVLVARYSKDFARFDVAFLPRMEADFLDESVPMLEHRTVVAVQTPKPEVSRPRYLQLAANVQNVWTAVQEYREAEVPAEVTVEVHVPAPVLQRINQTKMLASNLNQSWSTLQSSRSR